MFIDNPMGGQRILGITQQYKLSQTLATSRGRRSSQAISLSVAKTARVTVRAIFTSARNGTRVDAGEFVYRDRTGLLTMLNVDVASGIAPDPVLSYAIPLSYVAAERPILTNVYPDAEIA